MKARKALCISLGLAVLTASALSIPPVRRFFYPVFLVFHGKQTVQNRLAEFSEARSRVRLKCMEAGVMYPPQCVLLLALKQERRLEIYAGASRSSLRRIGDYPIAAASGGIGPKLREGDHQVPEGVYALESLNPNSRFHAALRVGYPNALDVSLAREEGRMQLGGDIMIHGGAASVGCLAMGDPAAEELFVLAAEAEIANVTIVISPVDLRVTPLPAQLTGIHSERYFAVRSELARLTR